MWILMDDVFFLMHKSVMNCLLLSLFLTLVGEDLDFCFSISNRDSTLVLDVRKVEEEQSQPAFHFLSSYFPMIAGVQWLYCDIDVFLNALAKFPRLYTNT